MARRKSNWLFYLFQQIVNPLRFIFTFIVKKFDGGNKSKIELLANFRTDKSSGALQAHEHVFSALAPAEQIEIDAGVAQIFAYVGSRQSHGTDTRISDLFSK